MRARGRGGGAAASAAARRSSRAGLERLAVRAPSSATIRCRQTSDAGEPGGEVGDDAGGEAAQRPRRRRGTPARSERQRHEDEGAEPGAGRACGGSRRCARGCAARRTAVAAAFAPPSSSASSFFVLLVAISAARIAQLGALALGDEARRGGPGRSRAIGVDLMPLASSPASRTTRPDGDGRAPASSSSSSRTRVADGEADGSRDQQAAAGDVQRGGRGARGLARRRRSAGRARPRRRATTSRRWMTLLGLARARAARRAAPGRQCAMPVDALDAARRSSTRRARRAGERARSRPFGARTASESTTVRSVSDSTTRGQRVARPRRCGR